MSGQTQRQRNAELELRSLKGQIGEVKETLTVHIHDFLNGRKEGPPDIITKDGVLIHIELHPYPEQQENTENIDKTGETPVKGERS